MNKCLILGITSAEVSSANEYLFVAYLMCILRSVQLVPIVFVLYINAAMQLNNFLDPRYSFEVQPDASMKENIRETKDHLLL